MDLRFVAPDLRRLDLAGTEVLICCLFQGERPPHGVSGLVDWRLAGRVSRLIKTGFATGAVGEVVLIPGKPKLPFDKVVLFGCGERGVFNEVVFLDVVRRMLTTLEGLHVRSAVVELPGRHVRAIAAERAADLLLEQASTRPEHDMWTLVEDSEGQRSITQHMIQERRRIRNG
jgi:hypothetical protein